MNQSQPFMAFNQELAEKSGAGGGIQDGGPHICTIELVKYVTANTGSHGRVHSKDKRWPIRKIH